MKNIMKLKNYKNPIFAIAILVTILSCSDDYLEVKPKGLFLTENYYQNENEAFAGLVSVYDILRKNSTGFENMTMFMNVGSDDHVAGGGGSGDRMEWQPFSHYTLDQINMPNSFWSEHYQGIYRANLLLLKLPEVPMDETVKNRFAGEAKALRALYYFNLVRMFKNVPLILEPISPAEMYNVTQDTPEAVYERIETDLLEALDVLPNIISDPSNIGRLTRGAAQALLGKVYLYQNKNELAAAQFAEVNGTPGGTSKYGYKLLDDFEDLWDFDFEFHSESIIEVSHTSAGESGWDTFSGGKDEGNIICVAVGPRVYKKTEGTDAPELNEGWGFSLVLPELYDLLKDDPRFESTILDMAALEAAGKATYEHGYLNTGYFLNKFIPTKDDLTELTGDVRLNYDQNTYIIRLADTYLMEAEALGGSGARAQALLDEVRERVGLGSIPVSMEAIMLERRLELAGEGHRWFDLVRTGKAASKLADRGFVAGKNEVFPIPYKELENTKIIQNLNYEQ